MFIKKDQAEEENRTWRKTRREGSKKKNEYIEQVQFKRDSKEQVIQDTRLIELNSYSLVYQK